MYNRHYWVCCCAANGFNPSPSDINKAGNPSAPITLQETALALWLIGHIQSVNMLLVFPHNWNMGVLSSIIRMHLVWEQLLSDNGSQCNQCNWCYCLYKASLAIILMPINRGIFNTFKSHIYASVNWINIGVNTGLWSAWPQAVTCKTAY